MEKWLIDALKAYPCKELEGGVFRSCPVRLSFPALFEAVPPKPGPDGVVRGKPKYSVVLLFPKNADLSVLRAGHKRVQDAKFPAHKGKLYSPFREQSEKGHIAGYEEGGIFITARSEHRPQVRKGVAGKLVAVHDTADIYPGAWGIVTFHFYDFVNEQQKGVTVGLNNVLKIRDDEAFGSSGSDPDADFAGAAVNLNDAETISVDDVM